MSNTTKSKVVNLFTMIVIFLTAFQGLIPTMPAMEPTTVTLVSALTMFFVSGFTTWKQFLSSEIDNSAVKPTLIVALIATIGALNDLFNVIHVSNITGQWIRFGITLVTMFLNVASKVLWPTDKTKSTF